MFQNLFKSRSKSERNSYKVILGVLTNEWTYILKGHLNNVCWRSQIISLDYKYKVLLKDNLKTCDCYNVYVGG